MHRAVCRLALRPQPVKLARWPSASALVSQLTRPLIHTSLCRPNASRLAVARVRCASSKSSSSSNREERGGRSSHGGRGGAGSDSRDGTSGDGQSNWDNASIGAACLAVAIGAVGLSYASVPLYRIFCQATGYGGTVRSHKNRVDGYDGDGYDLPEDPASLPGNRHLTVTFNTDVAPDLPWSFKPAQSSMTMMAGETALAFFETTNHSTKPIIGVATYNVTPMQAGPYFNKIQCFCFDEQRLLPGETVDMPVFFYIDPEFLKDRRMKNINTMTLSYTFWKSSDDDE